MTTWLQMADGLQMYSDQAYVAADSAIWCAIAMSLACGAKVPELRVDYPTCGHTKLYWKDKLIHEQVLEDLNLVQVWHGGH